jgi:hypothetical protein
MKQFIGTKLLLAVAMTLGAYNEKRGWTIPENEDPNREGYLVEYPLVGDDKPNHPDHHGYISWSPKQAFESAYRQTDAMNFGLAVEAAKKGLKVARAGWNGNGMFAYIVPAASFPALTQVAKSFFGENAMVPYREYWALKTAQDDVATWAPSGSDSLAEDWMIVE